MNNTWLHFIPTILKRRYFEIKLLILRVIRYCRAYPLVHLPILPCPEIPAKLTILGECYVMLSFFCVRDRQPKEKER